MNQRETRQSATPDANDGSSPGHRRTLVLIAFTAFGIYLCYAMAAPFLPALVLALALAVLFAPLQHWLESKLKRASLAAAISVLAISLIGVVPATFVAQQLVLQAAKGAQLIETKIQSGEWQQALQAQPRLAPLAARIETEFDLPGTFNTLTTWLSGTVGAILKGSLTQMIGLLLTLYLLFFFLRDRHDALRSLRVLSPLTETEMDQILSRVSDTIHATVYGTLAVSVVQGVLGGLMFWWLGLTAPLLWGVVMALLALVPVLGAFIVWIPAAVLLALEGSWAQALILTAWGIVVVGTVDNLLRPVLVGKRLRLHTIVAFISVVGGLIVFGAAGLILGPVVVTVTNVLLEIWSRRNIGAQPVDPASSSDETA